MTDSPAARQTALRLFTVPESSYDDQSLKQCRTCERQLPLHLFPANGVSSFGKARCNACMAEHDRLVRSQNYLALVERFGRACNCCGAEQCEPLRPSIRFCIDVDHQQMAVRGLLCKRCNVALGMLRDDPTVVAKLIVYLLERR